MHGDKAQLPPISHLGLAYLSLLPDASVICTKQRISLINTFIVEQIRILNHSDCRRRELKEIAYSGRTEYKDIRRLQRHYTCYGPLVCLSLSNKQVAAGGRAGG